MKYLLYICLTAVSSLLHAQYDSLSRFDYHWPDRQELVQYHGQSVQWIPLYDEDSSSYVIKEIFAGEYDSSPVIFVMESGITKEVNPIQLGTYKTLILEGYLQKLKSTYLNQNVRFQKKPFRGAKELVTGEQLTIEAGEVWKCVAVDLDRSVSYQPFVYLINDDGQRIRLVDRYWKDEHPIKLVEVVSTQ